MSSPSTSRQQPSGFDTPATVATAVEVRPVGREGIVALFRENLMRIDRSPRQQAWLFKADRRLIQAIGNESLPPVTEIAVAIAANGYAAINYALYLCKLAPVWEPSVANRVTTCFKAALAEVDSVSAHDRYRRASAWALTILNCDLASWEGSARPIRFETYFSEMKRWIQVLPNPADTEQIRLSGSLRLHNPGVVEQLASDAILVSEDGDFSNGLCLLSGPLTQRSPIDLRLLNRLEKWAEELRDAARAAQEPLGSSEYESLLLVIESELVVTSVGRGLDARAAYWNKLIPTIPKREWKRYLDAADRYPILVDARLEETDSNSTPHPFTVELQQHLFTEVSKLLDQVACRNQDPELCELFDEYCGAHKDSNSEDVGFLVRKILWHIKARYALSTDAAWKVFGGYASFARTNVHHAFDHGKICLLGCAFPRFHHRFEYGGFGKDQIGIFDELIRSLHAIVSAAALPEMRPISLANLVADPRYGAFPLGKGMPTLPQIRDFSLEVVGREARRQTPFNALIHGTRFALEFPNTMGDLIGGENFRAANVPAIFASFAGCAEDLVIGHVLTSLAARLDPKRFRTLITAHAALIGSMSQLSEALDDGSETTRLAVRHIVIQANKVLRRIEDVRADGEIDRLVARAERLNADVLRLAAEYKSSATVFARDLTSYSTARVLRYDAIDEQQYGELVTIAADACDEVYPPEVGIPNFEKLQKTLREAGAVTYTLTLGGEVVAFMQFVPYPDSFFARSLYARLEVWNSGLGRAFLNEAIKRETKGLSVEADCYANNRMLHVYVKEIGFRVKHEIPDYYPGVLFYRIVRPATASSVKGD